MVKDQKELMKPGVVPAQGQELKAILGTGKTRKEMVRLMKSPRKNSRCKCPETRESDLGSGG